MRLPEGNEYEWVQAVILKNLKPMPAQTNIPGGICMQMRSS